MNSVNASGGLWGGRPGCHPGVGEGTRHHGTRDACPTKD